MAIKLRPEVYTFAADEIEKAGFYPKVDSGTCSGLSICSGITNVYGVARIGRYSTTELDNAYLDAFREFVGAPPTEVLRGVATWNDQQTGEHVIAKLREFAATLVK